MRPILPGSTLGVMGGGQLGRMFVHAAQRLGYFTAVLDPDPHSPAGRVSHHHVQTDYTDPQGLAQLAQLSAAITTEFENVPAQALEQLARSRPVAPGAACVAIAQDRIEEKAHFSACAALSGVDCAPYSVIRSAADFAAVASLHVRHFRGPFGCCRRTAPAPAPASASASSPTAPPAAAEPPQAERTVSRGPAPSV